jgi:HEAT repeat protein
MNAQRLAVASLLLAILMAGGTRPVRVSASDFLDKSYRDWFQKLDSKDARVRRGAAFALGQMGADAGPAARRLGKALSDPDPTVREAVAFALGEIGPDAESVVPALIAVLGNASEPPLVRRSAAYALGGIKSTKPDPIRALSKALADGNAEVRQNAAWALGKLPVKEDSTPARALTKALTDADPVVRRDVVGALGDLGSEGHAALPELLDRATDEKDETVRKAVVTTLVNLVGPEDKDAITSLRPALRDKDPEIVRAAALAIGNVGGKNAVVALPALRHTLTDASPTIRRQAAGALANLGEGAAPAVGDLTRVLIEDEDPAVRAAAALALSRIGPEAVAAVPALARALERRDNPRDVHKFAAEALARIGKNLGPAVPALLRHLKESKYNEVRQRCVWALGRLSDLRENGAAEALEAVLDEQDDDSVIVRYEAARYLARHFGESTSKQAIVVLGKMLRDPRLRIYTKTDAKVSRGAVETGGGDTKVTPNLAGDARCLAAEALGEVGRPVRSYDSIVDELRRAANDRDEDKPLRDASRDALKRIRP